MTQNEQPAFLSRQFTEVDWEKWISHQWKVCPKANDWGESLGVENFPTFFSDLIRWTIISPEDSSELHSIKVRAAARLIAESLNNESSSWFEGKDELGKCIHAVEIEPAKARILETYRLLFAIADGRLTQGVSRIIENLHHAISTFADVQQRGLGNYQWQIDRLTEIIENVSYARPDLIIDGLSLNSERTRTISRLHL